MEKREQLEQELKVVKMGYERNYNLKEIISQTIQSIGDDTDERIRRIDQYLLSESMAEVDKVRYIDKKQEVLKQYQASMDSTEEFQKRINMQCKESENKIRKLESQLSEIE